MKVRVLFDWVGSAKMDESLITFLLDADVTVRKFHPPHWSHLGRLNNRTHRKLLIVDGRVGFTGGVGVAPQWTAAHRTRRIGATHTSRSRESMQLMYSLAITVASRSQQAMKRGVRLRIIVPGKHIDTQTVRSASRATRGPLRAASAVIAE